ncbi:2-amino-4-hydroxy-6-hydroxymethyldihydropteridine diphosphokinase [Flagellatimonas centrodinii]|uniref:2-amino-4-hydroxy-6- hydroxymethyldihydropteridine diphosphokinase n=1 Tax=Flagellatimonas centrodinii TaxID=2806210 RepID=UPI001FEEDCE6|nr:2-amino-4-hydroxy-6-hydroxymethyldihydropteridine diphosphokinase [Flagellatimonas centrodinii]ULQ45732.1 2-amino-4-hydroxy-6-hydroxymethyldihydropteridine diphosphokinase [Flagellatimonas centrodinii]
MSGGWRAWVALGANLGQPAAQVRQALEALAATDGIDIVTVSPFYRTAPLGLPGQADYCNAVAAIHTQLPPEPLMAALLRIEREAGRIRGGDRWGPRVLDLDLLHVDGEIRDTDSLRLPHPEAGRRVFVMVPWADIAPELVVPGIGRVGARAVELGRDGIAPWAD